MGKYKYLILKTAAVVSCVVALGITGCQGGNNEATAVKNKSNIEVSTQNAKGESVDVQGNGKEDIEAVGRCAEPARASAEAGSSDTKSVNGYVGSDRRNGEASSNDNERSEEKGRTDPKADSKAEQPEDEDSHAGEKDRGTDSSSEPLGAGDGFDAESAVSSISDMESADSSAGWDGGMENDSAVSDNSGFESEQSEYSYGSGVDEQGFTEDAGEYDYEYEDPGTVEEGEGSTEGYDESVFESAVPDAEYEEAGDGWEYYGSAFITHFCPCEICCGSYASGVTASGTWATEGRTVAAGYSIPFGTEVMINGNVYIVEDRGVDDGCFDIFVSDHQRALDMGAYYTEVYIRW